MPHKYTVLLLNLTQPKLQQNQRPLNQCLSDIVMTVGPVFPVVCKGIAKLVNFYVVNHVHKICLI